MTTIMTKIYSGISGLALAFVLVFLFSCTENENVINKDSSYVTFKVQTPYYKVPTYAMDYTAENTVSSIDVLAFRRDPIDQKEYFAYRSEATSISDKGNLDQKEFTVELKKDEDEYRFVILANVKAELDVMSLSTTGQKEQVLARLISVNPDRWNTTSPSDFKPIPMWGETPYFTIITDETKNLSGISLLRSVVSIDVVVDAAAQAGFKLKEVYLYNHKTRGRVVPIGSYYDITTKKVTAPSLPVDNDPANNPLNILDPLEYTTTDATKLEKQIYTYEAVGVNSGADLEATCLVVGGTYNNNTSVLTYYRLDFKVIESGSFAKYMSLLRNHRYTVHITEVTAAGYGSADEAFRQKKGYMQINIQEWSMSDMQDEVDVVENYRFRVSQTVFTPASSATSNIRLTVQTDYPGTITYETSDSWITLNNISSDYKTVLFSVAANNGAAREGKITIKVRNLTKEIIVRQAAL